MKPIHEECDGVPNISRGLHSAQRIRAKATKT